MKKEIYIVMLLFLLVLGACGPRNHSKNNDEEKEQNPVEQDSILVTTKAENKIGKVIFYLENSESMFGYVNGFTEYVDVVSELSEKPEFAAEKTENEFYFINGGSQIQKIPLGNNPDVLKPKLSIAGFNCGDIKKSNLNSMFQIAIEKAQNDTISILISDGIYDIETKSLSELIKTGKETRRKFIYRLQDGDLQTLLIKLTSNFRGDYFYSSHHGEVTINQPRPFYIWIFGKTELLNQYFTEEYISQHLSGYQNYARFLTIGKNNIPFQLTPSINRKGEFKTGRRIKNGIFNAKSDRNGEGFSFSFAVDYTTLPFSESYLTNANNYSINNRNFDIEKIEKINNNQKYGVTDFINPTHIITIFTDKNPCSNIEIILKNDVPNWIAETNANDELNIDSIHTFGFSILTNAIDEAYKNKNKGKNLAKFEIIITNSNEPGGFNWWWLTLPIGLIIIGLVVYNKQK